MMMLQSMDPIEIYHAARPARIIRVLLLLAICLGSTACTTTRYLMPTPHLYSEGHEQLFDELNPKLKHSTMPVFYVTDRAPETDEQGRLGYGYGRSPSIGFGEALVEIGEGVSWEEVVAASTTRDRDRDLTVELRSVREIGRTPPTPLPFIINGGFFEVEPDAKKRIDEVAAAFHREVDARLALTPRKEILLFVHGFNNDFEYAASTLASLWHFFGREGVPILYTWPAGRGGLAGYAYDRESGEFTVHHLKMLLRALAANPNIEGIRVVGHSRGADVLSSALRELLIETRAAGVDPRFRFRIKQVVLAAPDLDLEVAEQRIMTEPVAPAVGGVTVYVSQTDDAIGLAEWLFGSVKRLGTLQFGDLDAESRRQLRSSQRTNVVELQGEGGSFGHAYFHENPAVSSDLLQVLRFDRPIGQDSGRPLAQQAGRFWVIEDDYLLGSP
jgi:esterase/lipase superfamily enzyme